MRLRPRGGHVTQADDGVRVFPPNVRQHGLAGRQIAMNVGDEGDPQMAVPRGLDAGEITGTS